MSECEQKRCEDNGEVEIVSTEILCNTTCREGYVYQPSVSSCCGSCEAEQCVMEDGVLLKPGNHHQIGRCSKLTCKIVNGNPLLKEETTSCRPLPEDCPTANIKYDDSGCCQICSRCKDSDNRTRNIGEVWRHSACTTCSCSGTTVWRKGSFRKIKSGNSQTFFLMTPSLTISLTFIYS